MPIDRSKLPYPGTDVTMSRRGGRHRQGGPQLHQLASGEEIAMGHAQWSKAYRESGGKLADAEGVFSFSESGVTFLRRQRTR